MQGVRYLTWTQLVVVLERIQRALYGTEYLDAKGRPKVKLDRNKVWDAGTIEEVDQALVDAGLSPEVDPDA